MFIITQFFDMHHYYCLNSLFCRSRETLVHYSNAPLVLFYLIRMNQSIPLF